MAQRSNIERTDPTNEEGLKKISEEMISLSNKIENLTDLLKQYGQGSGSTGEGLYNDQIEEIMNKYKAKGFKGVYAIDEINKIPISDKMGVVLNLDPSNKPGSHWVALYIDSKGDRSVEYYDSFGRDPPASLMKDLKQMIDKINPNVYLKFKINKIKQQSVSSDNCGFFAMQFLIDRFNGKPFKECSGYSEVAKGEKKAEKFKHKLEKFGYI
jgi:hypothetical protein